MYNCEISEIHIYIIYHSFLNSTQLIFQNVQNEHSHKSRIIFGEVKIDRAIITDLCRYPYYNLYLVLITCI